MELGSSSETKGGEGVVVLVGVVVISAVLVVGLFVVVLNSSLLLPLVEVQDHKTGLLLSVVFVEEMMVNVENGISLISGRISS